MAKGTVSRRPPSDDSSDEGEQPTQGSSTQQPQRSNGNARGKQRRREPGAEEDEGAEDGDRYDPEQDKQAKRQTRKALRAAGAAASEIQENAADYTNEAIADRIRALDQTFDHGVRAPAEATLDARAFRMHAETGMQKARKMKIDSSGFDLDEFVTRLVNRWSRTDRGCAGDDSEEDDQGDEAEARARGPNVNMDWEALGRRVMAYSRRAPAMDLMYGPLETEQKKRKATQRAKIVKDNKEKVAPTQLENGDIVKSEVETPVLVQKIGAILTAVGGVQGINFFRFIVHPQSFSQTVENLFYFSFLIKEGRACLEVEDDDGVELEWPIAYATDPPDDTDQAGGVQKRQLVLDMDMETWQAAIEALQLEGEEPVIPDREGSGGTVIRGRQYG